MNRFASVMVAVVLALACGTRAQDTAPTLTDVQKLTIQNLAQRIEIAQLRAQQAQAEFDKARQAIGKLVQSLQVEGYELRLETLEYVKKPQSEKKNEAPKK
jgi:hypothetical protein